MDVVAVGVQIAAMGRTARGVFANEVGGGGLVGCAAFAEPDDREVRESRLIAEALAKTRAESRRSVAPAAAE